MDRSSGSYQGLAYGRPRGRSRGRLRSMTPSPVSSMFGEQSPMSASPAPSMFGQPRPPMPASLSSSMFGQPQSPVPPQVAMYGAMAPPPPPTQTARREPPPSPALTSSILLDISSLMASVSGFIAAIKPQQFDDVITESVAILSAANVVSRGAHRGRQDELATRPTDKTGLSGNPIRLVANYFRLVSLPQWCVHQYHVDFLPLVESSRIRRALINDHCDQFGHCFVFDGMSDLKTPTRLPQEITELYSQQRTGGAPITIRIKWVQELAPTHPDLLHLINTQMRCNLEHLDFVQINRRFFDKRAVSTIPQHGLKLLQGLITAIGQYKTGVMMLTDTVDKVLRRDSVLDLLSQVSPSGSHYRDKAMKRVVGCIVMTPYNNKMYRVDDIDWDESPSSFFETKDGPKTYIQYYAEQYEKCIRDSQQPLLVCRPKEKDLPAGCTEHIYLVPELCVLTGLTDEMRTNVYMMRDLAQHRRIDPPKRVRNLLEFIARVIGNETICHEMESWGLALDNALVSIDACTLPPKKVMQSGQVYCYSPATADFSREMRDKRLHMAVAIDSWLVVCPKHEEGNVTEFVRNLMSVCPPMGIRMGQPQMLQLDDWAGNYVRALRQFGGGKNLQLALVVVPNNRKDRYNMIKKEACINLGIQTQVILAHTIKNRKNMGSVATKVAIQLNCKLGGEAWCFEIPLSNTMVIGYDTYPDASSCNRSAGAFVASMNRTFTRWYSRVSFHASHQELGSTLALHLKDALCKYAQVNDGAFPERIIFFRDIVSDDQILQVRKWEIDQIVSSLNVVFPGVKHKLAFVIVTKRISTRFFAHTTSGGFGNPPPSTFVDSEVTRPERYDFFLVSQSVRQGTVSPTHYDIIYGTTGLKPNHMQCLSYKLTHLYFNWPGTIRVPAPCKYAHKLAFLAGQSLHKEPSPRLCSTLFYL